MVVTEPMSDEESALLASDSETDWVICKVRLAKRRTFRVIHGTPCYFRSVIYELGLWGKYPYQSKYSIRIIGELPVLGKELVEYPSSSK